MEFQDSSRFIQTDFLATVLKEIFNRETKTLSKCHLHHGFFGTFEFLFLANQFMYRIRRMSSIFFNSYHVISLH